MSRIRSLKPNVTHDEAVEHFSMGGPIGTARRILYGPLRSVADIYVPFRLFQVELKNADQYQTQYLAVDAVKGDLDLYHLPQIPSESDIVILETRNCLPAALDDVLLTRLIISKFRRIVFSRGFFRLRSPEFTASPLPGDIHVPYWIGFCGHRDQLRFDVIDAVRRRREGAKVRKLLHEWLSSAH
jgi:hypothetical protein